jgi:hypothetical protein
MAPDGSVTPAELAERLQCSWLTVPLAARWTYESTDDAFALAKSEGLSVSMSMTLREEWFEASLGGDDAPEIVVERALSRPIIFATIEGYGRWRLDLTPLFSALIGTLVYGAPETVGDGDEALPTPAEARVLAEQAAGAHTEGDRQELRERLLRAVERELDQYAEEHAGGASEEAEGQ